MNLIKYTKLLFCLCKDKHKRVLFLSGEFNRNNILRKYGLLPQKPQLQRVAVVVIKDGEEFVHLMHKHPDDIDHNKDVLI